MTDKSRLLKEEKQFIHDKKLKHKSFIGRFNETKSGYVITDIRRFDFSKIKYKPSKSKAFTIKVTGHLDQITKNDSYYSFSWNLVEVTPDYVFELDDSKDIKLLAPKDIVKLLYDDIYEYPASASEKIVNTLDTLKNQLTASGKEVFIYELLQNANDYPQIVRGKKKAVDVEFHITDNYLVFQHSGDYFDPKNIAAICSINDKEKTDNAEAIGYKGIGFKTVFLDNNYVLLRTGEYQFRFDYDFTKNIEDTPWQILPIWTEDKNVEDEVLDVIDNADEKFRVQIALRPTEQEILHDAEQNYEELFADVFETERVILFIPFVNSVSVYIGNEDTPSIVRIKENSKWCVSESKRYVGDVPPELTEELNRRIEKQDGKIPEKYKNFEKTSVGFACPREGRYLKPVENSCLYCYLPAKKAKLGFGFLMNTDMIPTGPRDNVEPKEKINHAIAKIAGQQFFEWMHDLLESGKYDYDSVFSLIPDFDELEDKYDDEDVLKFIDEFKEGFEEALEDGKIIPVLNNDGNTELVSVKEVNYDVTGITCSGFITDDEVRSFTEWGDDFVHPDLRDYENVALKPNITRFMDSYASDDYVFDEDVLIDNCENDTFSEWLLDDDNNSKFLEFLVSKEYIKDFDNKNIFRTEGGDELKAACDIYYDIDEYYNKLVAFDDYLPRLSMNTRKYFDGNEDWEVVKDSIFKEFDCDNFVDQELLGNLSDTQIRLNSPEASYGFYDFLAQYVGFSDEYKKLPVISFDDNVIEDFSREIFFYNVDGEELYNESWTEPAWVNLISEKYSDATKEYFKENFNVKDFSKQTFVDDILLSDTGVQEAISELEQEHFDFIHYCYANKDCFKKGGLKSFAVWTYDKEENNEHILPEDVIFFDSEKYDYYQDKTWIKTGWMYVLDNEYFRGISAVADFKKFLSDKFGILTFSEETFYKNVVAKHALEICKNIGGTRSSQDTEESIDVLNYLGTNYKLIFEENSNGCFIQLPLYRYDSWNGIVNRDTSVYLYDEELKDALEAKWAPENFVYMLEEDYNEVFRNYPELQKKLEVNNYSFNNIKTVLLSDINSLKEIIAEKDENISFHRFMFAGRKKITNEEYKKLGELVLWAVDVEGNERSSDIDEALYISNDYMESGKGIETLVSKYDESALFTSAEYLDNDADNDATSAWKEYFVQMGVKSDNKDIIFNSVLPNLADIYEKNIVSLLVGYYDYFHADDEWETNLNQLKKLNVVVKSDDNNFLPLKDVLFNDCYEEEPFPYLVIKDEIADFYHQSPDVMRLLREIVDGSKQENSDKYRSFKSQDEWKKEKLKWYLYVQTKDKKSLSPIHTRFICDLAKDYSQNIDLYGKVNVKEILLFGKDNEFHKATELTEGSAYEPRCDFERFGIEFNYLSDNYISFENSSTKDFRRLFTDMGVTYDFQYSHIGCMCDNYEFTVYFWSEYLTQFANRTHITAGGIHGTIAQGLNKAATIPTGNIAKKEVLHPHQLYSQSLIQNGYVIGKVNNYEDKTPLEKIFSTEEVKKILCDFDFATTLSFGDCLTCLLYTKDKDKRRDILSWLASKNSLDHTLVDKYLADERSVWKNGRREFVKLSELLVLHIDDDKLKQLFGRSPKVLLPEYIESNLVFDAFCRIFKIKALQADDFDLIPDEIEEPTTEEMHKILRLPLLIIAAVSDAENWKRVYGDFCQKLDGLNFHRCKSITFNYQDILKDTCIQYHKNGNDLYFVKDWKSNRVFKDLVFELVDYLDIDMDGNLVEAIFDSDETTQASLIEQYVNIGIDDEFRNILSGLNKKIADDVTYMHEDSEDDETNTSFGASVHDEKHDEDESEDETPENASQNSKDDSELYDEDDDEENQSEETDTPHDDTSSHSEEPKTQHSERKTRSDFGKTHAKREQTHEGETEHTTQERSPHTDNEETNQKSVEERMKEKWENKAQRKVGRPYSAPSSHSPENSASGMNGNIDNKPSDEPFFGPSNDYNYSEQKSYGDYSRTSQNMKRRKTEAQNSAQNASDQMDVFDLWQQTPKYTFLWFKYLMELQFDDDGKTHRRQAQIDFRDYEVRTNKIVRLQNPSVVVPLWLENAGALDISLIGKTQHKVQGTIVKISEEGVDLQLSNDDQDKFKDLYKVRVNAESSTNIVDSLTTRFLQLDYEDDYNLNDNLPKDINFIYGPPGTGKTTRLVQILHDIVTTKDNVKKILVLTPTNKAADVIATKLVDDSDCYQYLTRFGSTESRYLIEDAAVLCTRDNMNLNDLDKNIVVTTMARYSYDCMQPDDVAICDVDWDYIIIDEASMIELVSITYVLHKAKDCKFIIAGDPKQIQPGRYKEIEAQNIYQMVGLDSFCDAVNNYRRYPVETLMIQHRSIPTIGNLVSKFAYNGLVQNDAKRAPQKALEIDGISTKNINFIGFNIEEFDNLYGLTSINDSALHLYSAIFTYNMVDYMVKQITKKYPNTEYSIGVICPYSAEAGAIKQMIDNRPLDTATCKVSSGTVHKFQGDECDIMFIVLNPPANDSPHSHINNENIINVAMSRARDYLFFILPNGQKEGKVIKNRLANIIDQKDRTLQYCSDIETVMFGNRNYIYENTNVSCHLPVNVFYDCHAKYEVRIDDTALDIQINDND